MNPEKYPVNRILVGLVTLLCLGMWLAIWRFAPQDNTQWRLLQAAFVRVGCVMAAFWLALPTRSRKAAWANVSPTTFAGMLLALFAAAYRPRIVIPILIVLAIVGFFLRPREKKRPRSRPD
jgi:multisubunit Na+/H+ antiporter MnhF subunit